MVISQLTNYLIYLNRFGIPGKMLKPVLLGAGYLFKVFPNGLCTNSKREKNKTKQNKTRTIQGGAKVSL